MHLNTIFTPIAQGYDKAAVLPQEIAKRLLQRLQWMKQNPQRILDVGASSGFSAGLLEKQYPKAHVVLLDAVPTMLQQARQKRRWFSRQSFLCANTYQIPLADHSVDFIFANLLLHWCSDLPLVLQEWQRVLRPGGLLMFSTYGPKTLQELPSDMVSPFRHILELGTELQNYFVDPVLDTEELTLIYRDVPQLLREIAALGGAQKMGLSVLRKLIRSYPKDSAGRILASAEIIYGHAWGRELRPVGEKRGRCEFHWLGGGSLRRCLYYPGLSHSLGFS